jgi:hypothetical protein
VVFGRVGWVLTWLTAPVAAIAAGGVLTDAASAEDFSLYALSVSVLGLWLYSAWSVSRVTTGRGRLIYLSGCAILLLPGAAVAFIAMHR